MASRADKRDALFLDNFKSKICFELLNNSELDYLGIIKSLSSTNATGAPDYVFEQGYLEKFDLYDSERITVKFGKKQYLSLLSNGLLNKRVEKDRRDGTVLSKYYAGEELIDIKESRTNISYLHENLIDEAQEKTDKILSYEKHVNCSEIKGLLCVIFYPKA